MTLTITKFDWVDYTQSITELIVADMKNTRLLYSLEKTGLDVSPYQPRLYNTVFMLSGILAKDRTDELKDFYFKKLERVFEVEITYELGLFAIAEEIMYAVNSWKQPEHIFGDNL